MSAGGLLKLLGPKQDLRLKAYISKFYIFTFTIITYIFAHSYTF